MTVTETAGAAGATGAAVGTNNAAASKQDSTSGQAPVPQVSAQANKSNAQTASSQLTSGQGYTDEYDDEDDEDLVRFYASNKISS